MKKILAAITALSLLSVPASAISITGFYSNTFVTNQDPSGIGNIFGVQLWLEFFPKFPSEGLNGTYTLADNLHWTAIWTNGATQFFASSSQLPIPNPIDPSSYFTFTNNVVTAWAIIGNASVYGTAHLESIHDLNNPFGLPIRDYILEPNGAYAINSDSLGTWRINGIPVPGPIVGGGLPGLLLIGGWLVWRRTKRAVFL